MQTIKGLILAGGKSRRMGRDKSLITYHDKPQREYLFDLLKNHCEDVYLSCKNLDNIPEHLNPLPDHFNLNSPLNGIMSALKLHPHSMWLVVAVDMPFINSETVEYLIQHRNKNKLATCFYDSTGKLPEPLFSLWTPDSYNPLVKFFMDGHVSPRKFLIHQKAHLLNIPDKKVLTNINSDEEMKRLF